jgi:hypothetical protein
LVEKAGGLFELADGGQEHAVEWRHGGRALCDLSQRLCWRGRDPRR